MERQEAVFRYLVTECGLSIEEYGDLNDRQIEVLLREPKKNHI